MGIAVAFERHTYSGFEPLHVFDVVYGAHFEHRLVSAQRARFEHRRLVLGDVRIETGRYDFPVIAQGAMPPGALCIGFVAEGAHVTRYNTAEIGDDEIQVYAPGVELLYHASGASRWINFTTTASRLQVAARERFGRPLDLPQRGVASLRLQRGRRNHLRQLCDDAFALATALQPATQRPVLAQAIANALVVAYVDAVGTADAPTPGKTDTARRHYHLIRACEQLILSSRMVDVNFADIARRSGYTVRSLELIFNRGVGMTPSRWFTNLRLNGALRDLIAPDAEATVTEVATRWGFRHLSRFAESYRRAFGELPSVTLARSRAGAPAQRH